jgi:AbrB family looped-hinge helix DNA binding protein
MQTTMPALTIPGSEQTGFLSVDEKGRISLPKAVRQALDIQPGSSLAYAVIDGMLVLFSQDKQLALLMERASMVLTKANLTDHGLEEELLEIRGQIMRETYGDEFVDEIESKYGHLVGSALKDKGADTDDEH